MACKCDCSSCNSNEPIPDLPLPLPVPVEWHNVPPTPPPTPNIEEFRNEMDLSDMDFAETMVFEEEEFTFPILAAVPEDVYDPYYFADEEFYDPYDAGTAVEEVPEEEDGNENSEEECPNDEEI